MKLSQIENYLKNKYKYIFPLGYPLIRFNSPLISSLDLGITESTAQATLIQEERSRTVSNIFISSLAVFEKIASLIVFKSS